jgi:uncharacterized protein (TIGR04551 family)
MAPQRRPTSPTWWAGLLACLLASLLAQTAFAQPEEEGAGGGEEGDDDDDTAPQPDPAPAPKPEPPLIDPQPEPDPEPEPDPNQPKPAPKATPKKGNGKEKQKGAAEGEEGEGEERTVDPDMVGPLSEVYAEDWWTLSRPVFELHGYYRVRSEFFHNFSLGRVDGNKPLWPQPADHDYVDTDGTPHDVELCGDSADAKEACDDATQAGANMRFRINPELHISDNIRVRAQIDLLDNLVLGSTPQGYANAPGVDGGYQVVARGGYSPIGAFSNTQWAPVSGVNSTKDSILVKRVWGEYATPIGQLRFGRMPSHWGLGMLVNSGDGHDSDWQSTSDRLMFLTGIRAWDLYFAAAWDFANEGPNSAVFNEQDGQPYDLAQKDDVDQWVFVLVRRVREQIAKQALADGEAVIEGGAYVVYRTQDIANDTTDVNGASLGQESSQVTEGYVVRGAEAVIPDAWFRFRFEHFRFEMEAAMIYGSIDNLLRASSNYSNDRDPDNPGWNLRQFGIATEAKYDALDDKLHIGVKFGYASGDDDVASLAPIGNELQPQLTLDRTISTFRFHPDYRVDLILFRNILTRVEGAYYFRGDVGYDFLRDPDGQKIGGNAGVVWSRASEFVQAPGHARDLGVELNFKVYYQAKDGVLNDDLEQMGGFFTSIEYGVLFPLDGLGYLPDQVDDYVKYQETGDEALDTSTAQTVRWYLGILF